MQFPSATGGFGKMPTAGNSGAVRQHWGSWLAARAARPQIRHWAQVEIAGRPDTPASCITPAADGMVVTTQNQRLAKLRGKVIELYISDHPLDCLTCSANGNCEFQDMAGAVGLREARHAYDGANHQASEKDQNLRSGKMLCLLALSACLRGSPGDLCANHRRARLRLEDSRRNGRGFPRFRMRLRRRLRPGLPDRDPDGKIGHRGQPARAFGPSPPAPIAGSAAASRPR